MICRRWSGLALALLCVALSRRVSAQGVAAAPDGQKIYATTCAACHQASAEGLPERYPPLAKSDWVVGDQLRLVRVLLHGLTGEVEVQGETYSGAMPAWGAVLKDGEVASVATYIRSNFGNHAAAVTRETVARIRGAYAARTTPWTAPELSR
ncbi:MAG: hypothetical protein NVS1B4_08430 [Gemmatimonadaceae bacterium]